MHVTHLSDRLLFFFFQHETEDNELTQTIHLCTADLGYDGINYTVTFCRINLHWDLFAKFNINAIYLKHIVSLADIISLFLHATKTIFRVILDKGGDRKLDSQEQFST